MCQLATISNINFDEACRHVENQRPCTLSAVTHGQNRSQTCDMHTINVIVMTG